MQIGKYQVNLVDAGRFRLDGGAMFGVVPRVLWEKKKPADEFNRIEMATMLLLLQSEGKNILIDTGLGNKLNQKLMNIYGVDQSQHNLAGGLAKLHLSSEDITDVILTHLHFDHVGGATSYDESGKLQPTFPNATYYVHKMQYDWAITPSEKDKASYIQDNFVPLREKGQLTLLEDELEIFPDITLIPLHGHTQGMLGILIKGEHQNLFYAADLIPTSAHISIPWIMSYDLYPMTTLEEKQQYLELASEQDWWVFFEHDPEIYCGKITRTEKGFVLKESIIMD
ncbi:MAG: MBL fold metallo-hydrolase [Calditrichaeota bacterium]|nr:MAG: MBL fold metallo-hydrolase [Calditrichota bacterium]